MLEFLTPPNFPSGPLGQRETWGDFLAIEKGREKDIAFLSMTQSSTAGLSPGRGKGGEGLKGEGGLGSPGTVVASPLRVGAWARDIEDSCPCYSRRERIQLWDPGILQSETELQVMDQLRGQSLHEGWQPPQRIQCSIWVCIQGCGVGQWELPRIQTSSWEFWRHWFRHGT